MISKSKSKKGKKMKTVFITGAASGIGKATVKFFHQQGFFVGIYDLNEENIEALKLEISSDKVCGKVCDVTDALSLQSALEHFVSFTEGRLDIFINNAGVLTPGKFSELELKSHLLTIDVNIKGLTQAAYLAEPYLSKTRNSLLINMCSISSMHGVPVLGVYSASKSYVKSLTEVLRLEWKSKGIDVISIIPPFVKTPLIEQVAPNLLKKMGVDLLPEDVALAIWKASQKRQLHYVVGWKAAFLNKVFPLLSVKTKLFFMRTMTQ